MNDYKYLVIELYDLIRPFVSENIELSEETDLIDDLGLDSMKIMDLLSMIEDSKDISIPLNILPDIRTIKDFAIKLQPLLMQG